MSKAEEQKLYEILSVLPRPSYPFPDLVNPHMEELAQEYFRWIDEDYTFHSDSARALHKQHRLTDIPARAFPFLTLPELLPIARYASTGAMMDDYFDHSSHDEMVAIQERIMALVTGEDDAEPQDLGIFRQFYQLRQDALSCRMPEHLYEKFAAMINDILIGYQDEKPYIAKGQPPPLPVFRVIRTSTAGGLPFAKYLCMQKDFRTLPDTVLEHPAVLRMHELSSRLIGWHNDIISLPKELSRKGDVINLVLALRREHRVSLEDAYRMALEYHDSDLNDLVVLQNNLPDFGRWQAMAADYAYSIGIMVQGVYSWHTKNSQRYIPGAYVEPEYTSQQFRWATP